MSGLTWIHIGAGVLALFAGSAAFAARKGGDTHRAVGTAFVAAMGVLGLTAAILAPLKSPPDSPVGGIMVCYFVATAWMAARRRSGVPGRFERIACAFALLLGLAIGGEGVRLAFAPTASAAPPGPAGLIVLGALCLGAGLGDLRFVLRGRISPLQRITRHLWRMGFAFFIATGSFFLGQQDVLPAALRGSALLVVLALAPFGLMSFWLVRVRYARWIARVPAPAALASVTQEPG